MSLEVTFITLSFILALVIGTSNGAVSMAPSLGSNILTARKLSFISGVGLFLGAFFLGHKVAYTLGKGIVSPGTFESYINIGVFFANSIFFVTLANLFKVPISTTEIIVLSVAGLGIADGTLNTGKFAFILFWWFAVPPLMFLLGFAFEKFAYLRLVDMLYRISAVRGEESVERMRRVMRVLTVLMGFYFAFSAGANNVGNAVGVIVGGDMLSTKKALFFGGIFMMLGSALFSHAIMKTVGKDVTYLGLIRSSFLQFLEGSAVFVASVLGIPVSINQTITAGIVGISFAKSGRRAFSGIVRRILFFWFVVPWVALLLAVLLKLGAVAFLANQGG